MHITIYIRQVLTVLFFSCTTCIVYQYFKELAAFVLKAGAKVKALFLTTKLFRKFFLFFLFTHFSGSLCERERMYKRKNKGRFLCESDCKDKNFIYYPPKLSEVFLFFSLSAISLFHYVNSARLSSLGKRVQKYTLFVYNPNILKSFFEVFLKEYAKVVMQKNVVEHIFYHKWIGGGNGTHGTHYYITRGRVGARKREKDAEERNNKITVELQMRKDNRKKETRRQYRRKARK